MATEFTTTPPKRGRGRPRKESLGGHADTPAKRGPGRPRKESVDASNATPKRGPGRPRKDAAGTSASATAATTTTTTTEAVTTDTAPQKRGRGRPKGSLNKPKPTVQGATAPGDATPPVKRKPGRPPKNPSLATADGLPAAQGQEPASDEQQAAPVKRGPCRPRKSADDQSRDKPRKSVQFDEHVAEGEQAQVLVQDIPRQQQQQDTTAAQGEQQQEERPAKRPRGRPPKNHGSTEGQGEDVVKRPRGRPPKSA